MEFIHVLTEVSRQERSVAGGKGAQLGELTRAGFPVPPGFVLLTSAYQRFVDTNGLLEEIERSIPRSTLQELASFEQVSLSIRNLFIQLPLPEEIKQEISQAYQQLGAPAVAVRSSATTEDLPEASFAGLHESYLNVCTLPDILIAVQQCWSSLWTLRAMIYRARLHIAPRDVSMAVVIQQMVLADASGVLFTINPVNGHSDEVMINANWGLGEALVSGQVSPDTIIAEKVTGRVKQLEIGSKVLMTVPTDSRTDTVVVETARQQLSTLKDEQVLQLVQLGKRIETHFEMPQDIEWAISAGQLFIVQSRPITTQTTLQHISTSRGEPVPPGDDSWDREPYQPQPYDVWTRTNFGENLPYPLTPLTETNFPVIFGLNTTPPDPQQPQMVRRLYGRLYFNEGATLHTFEDMGLPASWMHKMWGSRPRGAHLYKNKFRPLRLLGKLTSTLFARFKVKNKLAKKEKSPRYTPEQFFAQIDQWINAFEERDLERLDDRTLWNDVGLPMWGKRGSTVFGTNMRLALQAAGSYAALERIVRWWTGKDLTQDLVTGLTGVYSAEIGPMLWRMAQAAQKTGVEDILLTYDGLTALELLHSREEARPLLEQLALFLMRHGHRCPNEGELLNPRWAEAPEQVIALVASYLRAGENIDPSVAEARQQQRRIAAVSIVEAKLDPIRRTVFRFLLKHAQRAVTIRDNSRYFVMKFFFPMRKIYAELGRRWAGCHWLKQPDDIFFLTLAEIECIIAGGPATVESGELQEHVTQRRLAYEFWFTVVPPDAIASDGLPIIEEEELSCSLKGVPASGGIIRGHARIVQTIQQAMALQPGDILVTLATDPGWTPVFPLVSGIVLEIGGQLSHGAIVAREYGIPAIVNVPGAMRLISDGQLIELDGNTGRIVFISK